MQIHECKWFHLHKLEFTCCFDPKSWNEIHNKYKVLSWNSRLAQAKRSLTQTVCNHIILYREQLIGSCCISSQWANCSAFKHLVSICCSSAACFQKPSTFPSSTCIDLLHAILHSSMSNLISWQFLRILRGG